MRQRDNSEPSDWERSRSARHQDTPELRPITERVCQLAENQAGRAFWLTLCGVTLVLLLIAALAHLVDRGIGVWGNRQSVSWAWDIAGFVFWIGIGHAGTLISAILFLFRQRWRTTINRAAEATTLFAVMVAAIYPVFHLGRVWLAYWLVPAPNQMLIWPNFKSPLTWDVFAISTYFCVSLLFWYLGLLPDLASLRDRAASPFRRLVLSKLSLGWRGSLRHWQIYERAYLTLAGLSTALVVSVHTIVSLDFAVSVLPGWHSTLFPPYFVAGAILSGSAFVGAILALMRRGLGLESAVTLRHIESLNKLVLATSWMVAAAYLIEVLLSWYGDSHWERALVDNRLHGSMAISYWITVGCNVLLPQLYWVRSIRRSVRATILIGVGVSVGMWFERFVIVVGGLERGFVPATFDQFRPTFVDAATLLGTFGLFLCLFLLFLRWVPIIAIHEVKADLVAEAAGADHAGPEASSSVRRGFELIAERPRTFGDHARRRLDLPENTLLGRCDDLRTLQRACRALQRDAWTFEAYAPHCPCVTSNPIEVDTARVAWCSGIFGAVGAGLALLLQYWTQAIAYPTSMSGKPAFAWQTAVPVTFECTILCAALGCFLGFLWMCRLPDVRHPLLAVERFRPATDNGYFVAVEVSPDEKRTALRSLQEAGIEVLLGVAR